MDSCLNAERCSFSFGLISCSVTGREFVNLISFALNEDVAAAGPAFTTQKMIIGHGRAGSS